MRKRTILALLVSLVVFGSLYAMAASLGGITSVSLTDTSGAQIGTGSLVIPTSGATSFAVTMSTPPSAKLTEGIHILIA